MSDKTLKTTIQFRRDTTENWVTNKDVVPAAGEPCFDKDTGVLKIGDGVATYENLPRVGGVSAAHYEGVKGDGESDTAVIERVLAAAGAEANVVKSASDEFTISDAGKLSLASVEMAKVTGLPDALKAKVDAVEGKGLSANDFTNELKGKLDGVEVGANENLIEIVKANGVALNISEKAVDIPLAGETAGLVVSSSAENKVAVAADGTMEVNSVNINKLVQTDGDTLILDGGSASV